MSSVTRRRWLQRSLTALGGLTVAACDRIAESPHVNSTLDWAEQVNQRVQRVLLGRKALAREYTEKDISREFRANGTTNPALCAPPVGEGGSCARRGGRSRARMSERMPGGSDTVF